MNTESALAEFPTFDAECPPPLAALGSAYNNLLAVAVKLERDAQGPRLPRVEALPVERLMERMLALEVAEYFRNYGVVCDACFKLGYLQSFCAQLATPVMVEDLRRRIATLEERAKVTPQEVGETQEPEADTAAEALAAAGAV